ncbi:MAG: c-type cytochrome [Chloroflexi bacterium]|nr:c-type cytochrome [Chloroflexota bacterium]
MKTHIRLAILGASLLAIALGVYILIEPQRMTQAAGELVNAQVVDGQIVYAENCAVCHNAAGEGLGSNPALNTEGLKLMDYDTLYKTIARGRYNTAMPAWSVTDGGPLNDAAINALIVMIQNGDWRDTQIVVADMGLAPRVPISVTVPITMLATIAALPDGITLAKGIELYAANCIACHGANGEGSPLAPALNDAVIRTERTADQLSKTIGLGSPGTVMAGWNQRLSSEEIAALVTLIQRWDEIPLDAIPQPPVQPIIVTEQLLATGQTLYAQTCSRCHGADGQGTRRAPALNVQTFFDKVTTDAALIQIVTSGVPGTAMPAWGDRLSVSEIEAVVAYVRAWEQTAPAVASPQTTGGGGPPWQRNGTTTQPVAPQPQTVQPTPAVQSTTPTTSTVQSTTPVTTTHTTGGTQRQGQGTQGAGHATATATVTTAPPTDWRAILLLAVPGVVIGGMLVAASFELIRLRKSTG